MNTLLVLIGLPGSGKSTLAQWLELHSNLQVVSRDTIRSAMFPDCQYTAAEKLAAFNAMKLAIETNLELGKSVCTDGITFASDADRCDVLAIAERTGARPVQVWCDVPVDLAQKRVAADTRTVFPDRTPEMVLEVAARFSDVGPDIYRLDMTLPTAVLGSRMLTHLQAIGLVTCSDSY